MDTVKKTIGVMDPNSFSYRETIESLFKWLKPHVKYGGKIHKVTTRRIKCKPYDTLNARTTCSAIINRGAHWNLHHNSFFQRVAHQTYLLNDMSSFFAINKNTSYGQMFELGLKIPPTFAIPQEDNSELENSSTVSPDLVFPEYELFDLCEIGQRVGYPAYLKPQNGGGWVGVQKVNSSEELLSAYKKSGANPQNLQKAVVDYKEFIRCVGMGPQVIPMHYNADAKFSHDRYMRGNGRYVERNFLAPEIDVEVKKICKIINAFYGWDHNSCESLLSESGHVHPIDFANAYPDSSLISLHYYFPDLVKNTVRWLLFITCTDRKKKIFGYDWEQYFRILEQGNEEGWDYFRFLDAYEKLADQHFSTQEFEDFSKNILGEEFEVKCYDFFAGEVFRQILEEEVERFFKIMSERPLKKKIYNEIHDLWLEDNRV